MFAEQRERHDHGIDFGRRLSLPHPKQRTPVPLSTLYEKKTRKHGALADLMIDPETKIAICGIEKVFFFVCAWQASFIALRWHRRSGENSCIG